MGAILDITSKWLPSNKGTNTKSTEVVEYNKWTGVKASNGYDKHNNIKGWFHMVGNRMAAIPWLGVFIRFCWTRLLRVLDFIPPWKSSHVCSSHHNHKTREDMEGCNKVREFQQEQEKRLLLDKQKLAEMDKMIKFAEKRQEHLVRKKEILHELRDRGLDVKRPEDLKKLTEDLETN